MTARQLPSYLAVVPQGSKRFRPPKPKPKPKLAAPELARLAKQTEYVATIVDRLKVAAFDKDEHALLALARVACIEAKYAAAVARDLSDPDLR